MSSLNLANPLKLLDESTVFKTNFISKIKNGFKKNIRVCNIVDTDVAKLSGNGQSLFSVSLTSNLTVEQKAYKYVHLLAVVISGKWHLNKSVGGGATVALLDKRITNPSQAQLAKMTVAAKVGEFQGRLTPNYSVTIDDAVKDPWEIFISIKDVPIEQGFHPLSVEVAALLMFSDICILKSLQAKMVEAKIGFSEGTDGDIPHEILDDFVTNTSVIQDLKRLRQAGNKLGSGVIGGRDKKGKRFTRDFKKREVVSDSSDTEFSGAESVNSSLPSLSESEDALLEHNDT
nr:movement protein [Hibiscus latent Hawaii virus]